MIISAPVLLGTIINILANNSNSISDLQWPLIAYIILTVSIPIIDIYTIFKGWVIGFKIANDFRQDLVHKLRFAGLDYWQDQKKGNVLRIIDKSYESMSHICGLMIHAYLPMVGKLIGILVVSAFITPFTLLIFALDILIFALNLIYLSKKQSKAGVIENISQENVNGSINEYIQNYKTVVYLNMYDKQETEILKKNNMSFKKYYIREKLSMWKWFNNNMIHSIALGIILIYGITQVFDGNLTIGALTTLMLFSSSFSESLSNIVWNSQEFIKYVNYIQRYHEVFSNINNNKRITNDNEKIIFFHSLISKNLSYERKGYDALSNIDFNIKSGEKVAIVGYTGSGKSTMLDILLKVITKYKGDIFINDINYNDLDVDNITGIFSIVPQDVQLFRDSIKNNIFISGINIEENHDNLIKISCLEPLIKRLKKGIDSRITEGSINVSGGERQRIGIARALAQNRPVLILDEATASLDPKTERAVITNIIDSYPNITLIYVTHKYFLLNYFDHILVLNEGKIVEQGSFEELKQRGGLFLDLYTASKTE